MLAAVTACRRAVSGSIVSLTRSSFRRLFTDAEDFDRLRRVLASLAPRDSMFSMLTKITHVGEEDMLGRLGCEDDTKADAEI